MDQTVICAKWGTRYPALYVNVLWSMVERNTQRPTRLVCYTDDASGVDPAVVTVPMPELRLPQRVANFPWRKLAFWHPNLAAVSGDVLFLDLDTVIVGSIDAFFDFAPESTFCVIENWTQKGSGIGNTSAYRFRVGAHTYLHDMVQADPEGIVRSYDNEQTFVSERIKEKRFWPAGWCRSFKHDLLPPWPLNFFRVPELPPDAKVICFTGKPDPDEARDGRWVAPLHKRLYKHVRPTPWIAEHWRYNPIKS
jgi:hypothetical protein